MFPTEGTFFISVINFFSNLRMKNSMKKLYFLFLILFYFIHVNAADRFVTFKSSDKSFPIVFDNKTVNILFDANDQKGIGIAVNNLVEDFNRVCGVKPELLDEATDKNCIIIGSVESKYIKQLIKSKKLDKKELYKKNEKYIITTVQNPLEGVEKALVIAGSDRRGTIYGIYELSEQMGVSP